MELIDDVHELNFQPGTLVQLTNVQGLTLTINPATATGSVNFADFPNNPKIRRWDSAGLVSLTTGSWLDLEDGVQVEFANGTYETGDYWLIPARTLTGDVEWRLDTSNNPIPEPPKGIHRHFCKLAVAQFDGTAWTVNTTCMPTFPPLTGLPTGRGDDPGIHVLDVRTISPAAELLNDSNVLVTVLREGIDIRCDAAVSSISIQPTTCFITVYVPFPLDPVKLLFATVVVGTQPIVLPGAVSVSGTVVQWRLSNGQTLSFLERLVAELAVSKIVVEKRLLMRLTMKGNVIWGADDPTLFLDGEAFGIKRGTNIGLQLPKSGNGKKGGDFEMWFWLAPPVHLAGMSFPPNGVAAGQNATGTLTLSGAAPAGGVVVTLTSQVFDAAGAVIPGANVGTVPATVTVPAGQTSAPFTVTNTSLPAGGFASLQVTAAYFGSTVQASLPITAPAAPAALAGGAKGRVKKRVSSK